MTDDILELIAEGAKWLAIGGGAYFGALMALPTIGFFSDKIKTQKELDIIIDEEAKKLGMNQWIIGYLDNKAEAKVRYHLEGEPISHIISVGGAYARRSFVKHEIYHIKKQHWKRYQNSLLNSLDYWFRREPQAIIYEVFGLKL